ncbi:hypothetical protein [Sphingomonas sp.]|uniref:hypothetical protein n=1 Tax=Sphingomonas sp. TaxID=28214 RepID=UPI001EBED2A9|nr:hypothetical protein [Sphingomonas sp.]MBX3595802.1 hypothetical protein [Sphingomonas sp.]
MKSFHGFGRAIAMLALTAAATPATAERITAYWQLKASPAELSARAVPFKQPFLTQRILPVKLVRLTEAATPAGSTSAVPAGTPLILVANGDGKVGYCTLKDWSGASQAKSLFIPALDKRPCFSDLDGDGAFDASFSVFYAYTRLSPPQPRGSINAATPMAKSARFEVIDPDSYPEDMTLTFALLQGKTVAKTKLRATLVRAGKNDFVDVSGKAAGAGVLIPVLGMAVGVQSATDQSAEIAIMRPQRLYIISMDNGTFAVPGLPAAVAQQLR